LSFYVRNFTEMEIIRARTNTIGNTLQLNIYVLPNIKLVPMETNTLRTGAFKLFRCTFPRSKQFKSTFILCFFKNL